MADQYDAAAPLIQVALDTDEAVGNSLAALTRALLRVVRAINGNIVIQLGDTAAATKISVLKSNGSEAFWFKSDGTSSISPGGTPVTGSGTTNKLPYWSSSSALGDSILSQSGTTLTVANNIALTGTVDGVDVSDFYAQRGVANGLALLDASARLVSTHFPALTGDITTVAGALATTLATVNANVGTFGGASSVPTITVNAKGLITAASATAVLVDLSGSQATGILAAARHPALTGDITTPSGSVATTLATVNANVGTFGSTTQSVQVTVNAKGLITAISNQTISIPTVSGTTGTIAKFTAANVVGNSIMTESGAKIQVAGAIEITGQSDTNQLIVKGHSTQTSGQIVIQTSAAAELARLYVNTSYSIGIGYQAGQSVTGADNIAIGKSALSTQTSGTANIAIGSTALRDCNSSGQENVAICARALEANTSGQYNVAIGSTNLYQATTAINNMAIGTNALLNCTASENVAIGAFAGYSVVSGTGNFYLGFAAGLWATGSRNIGLGSEAARTTGTASFSDSIYIGYRSGYGGSAAGSYNVGIGSETLQKNVSNAVAIGFNAGKVQTGAGFTAVGYQAGLLSTSGTNSTLIGSGAGASLTTNGGCVMIGYQAGNAETAANKLYIANSSTTTPLIYGDFSTPSLTFNGHVTHADAYNITFGSTTGSKIGTATSEKLAFHNSTPVIQRAGAAQAAVATTAATNSSPYGYTTAAQADAIVALVNEIRAALVEKGLIKGAA